MNLTSPRNLRLGALILVFIAINQIDDPLVDATLGQELLYWFVRITVMTASLFAADFIVERLLKDRWNRPIWLKPVVAVTAIAMVPFALAEILIEPHLPMRPEFVDDHLWAVSPFLAYLSEYVTVITIVTPVHLLLWLILDRGSSRDLGPIDFDVTPLPEFLQASSVRDVDAVQALQAEEHYVRIFTANGSELVHHRFGDAIKAMPEALGLRVHRSWWVADSAVESAKRGDRRWQLTLAGDLSVPVSDSYVAAVREKGWLKRKRTG